jgi:hypothetical protein
MNAASIMSFAEAKKCAGIRWQGRLENVYLATSLDRKTTLAIGWFAVGPRRGRQPRYAVRLGVDHQGIAMGGCCTFDATDAGAAVDCFLKYAAVQS